MAMTLGAAMEALGTLFDRRKRQAYQRVFAKEGGRFPREVEIVLADLRDFCRAERSTFDLDPRVSALLEGRRSVWLRLSNYLGLEEEEARRLVEVERE